MRKERFYPSKNDGLTLIEIMVTVCILGILAVIATPLYLKYMDKARTAVAASEIRTIERAITSYVVDHASYPDTLDQVGMGDLLDPWGNPYQYLKIHGAEIKGKAALRKDHFLVPVNTDYDLYSMGKDGASVSPFTAKASRDDIVRAFNGSYCGKVSDM